MLHVKLSSGLNSFEPTLLNVAAPRKNHDEPISRYVRARLRDEVKKGKQQKVIGEESELGKSLVNQIINGLGVGPRSIPRIARYFGFGEGYTGKFALERAVEKWWKEHGEKEALAERPKPPGPWPELQIAMNEARRLLPFPRLVEMAINRVVIHLKEQEYQHLASYEWLDAIRQEYDRQRSLEARLQHLEDLKRAKKPTKERVRAAKKAKDEVAKAPKSRRVKPPPAVGDPEGET